MVKKAKAKAPAKKAPAKKAPVAKKAPAKARSSSKSTAKYEQTGAPWWKRTPLPDGR